jgi:uncharacterized coiled-coil DUF342 family protein
MAEPLENRMDHVEEKLEAVHSEVRKMRAAQEETTEALRELRPVVSELATQSAAILGIQRSVLSLREEVTKWAAAGALAGSVALFIAVRALGF